MADGNATPDRAAKVEKQSLRELVIADLIENGFTREEAETAADRLTEGAPDA